jgi:hypothetical protein
MTNLITMPAPQAVIPALLSKVKLAQSRFLMPSAKARQGPFQMIGALRGSGMVSLVQGDFSVDYHVDAFAAGSIRAATGSLEGLFPAGRGDEDAPTMGRLRLANGAWLEITVVEQDETLIEFDLPCGPILMAQIKATNALSPTA